MTRVKLMKESKITQLTQSLEWIQEAECREAETKLTGKPRTQNSHGRLSRLKHLENLGLKRKTERRGQKPEG